jgi:hypothetical protein
MRDNSKAKSLPDEIERVCPCIDNDKYQQLVVYPLLRMHIDFLVCRKDVNAYNPVLAIELNGGSHESRDYHFWNDDFKQLLFNRTSIDRNSNQVNVKLDLWQIRNCDLDDNKFIDDFSNSFIDKLTIEEVRNKQFSSTPVTV